MKPNPYALDSVSNALHVISLLGERSTITVTEVATELGIGKSTAHRLLMTLVAEDFATRDPVHRRYHAGRALVGAGLAVLGDFDVRKRTSRPMRQLTEKTGETTKLLILEGPFARVLELAETEQSLRIGGSVGQLLPANATAGGKLLLCDETEEALRARFGRRLPAITDETITDWNELMVELAAIRKRGWAANVGESTLGVSGLAVPVAGRMVPNAAVLTLAAPTARLPRSMYPRTIALMFETAKQIRLANAGQRQVLAR
jgi:DNA-binding IclR family transcriptional regulator